MHEISQSKLKHLDGIKQRFWQDVNHQLHIFIWQNETSLDDEDFGIIKFQISFEDHLFEYKRDGNLKYGKVDDGFNLPGIKRSPIMILDEVIDNNALVEIIKFMETDSDNLEQPEFKFITELLKKSKSND